MILETECYEIEIQPGAFVSMREADPKGEVYKKGFVMSWQDWQEATGMTSTDSNKLEKQILDLVLPHFEKAKASPTAQS